MEYNQIEDLPREKLLEIIDIYAKNWLAMDGVWFQSVEQKYGMDEAMHHDKNAWRRFTVIEAKRIKALLDLPDQCGLEGLKRALQFRLYARLVEAQIITEGNTLTYRVKDCRVQTARKRKGMPYHPCKSVGIIEYEGFAKTIDERISAQCVSCHPEITDDSCACIRRFTLKDS